MSSLHAAYTTAREQLTALETVATYSRTVYRANITSYFAATSEFSRLETIARENARYAQLEAMFKHDEKLEDLLKEEFEEDGLDHDLAELLLEGARMVVDECRAAKDEARVQYHELLAKVKDVKGEVTQLQIACRNWAEMRCQEVQWEGRGAIFFP